MVMMHPHHGIPLSNKKKESTGTRNNLDESSTHCANWKKASLRLLAVRFHSYRILQDETVGKLPGAGSYHCKRMTGWRVFFGGGKVIVLFPDYGDSYVNIYMC